MPVMTAEITSNHGAIFLADASFRDGLFKRSSGIGAVTAVDPEIAG
jgi:hypothetical protein